MTPAGDETGVGPRIVPTSSLLRSKLRSPVPPEHYVRRSRLLELLDDMVRRPLTLVVAPAGAGKTSMLADWLARSPMPRSWLSLDETDRDRAHLWLGITVAVDALVPGCAADAIEALQRPGGAADAVQVLLSSLDEVAAEPKVLVMDDVHCIDDSAEAVESLGTFLQHLPGWLRVVVVGRRAPRLPIDRLRARGQLSEIRFAELRFSEAEAVDLLSRLSPGMAVEELSEATEHAGGWAAGLQLAALAARSTRAQADSFHAPRHDDSLVEDYVWHEVLTHESPELVDVLLNTSVVERVNRSLAIALTGRTDAEQLLRSAEERGLFVTRLGSTGWFEVHSLVREILLSELFRRSPGILDTLHQRAAQWYEEAGEETAGLDHWLAGNRPREALRLLAASEAKLYDSGRESTITRVITRIPVSVSAADLEAQLEFAWCHLLVDRHRFLEYVAQAVDVSRQTRGVDKVLRGRVAMLQSIAATMVGDWHEGGRQAREAMSELGEAGWLDLLGRFGWNMVARDIALSERWHDAADEVREVRTALSVDPERRLAFEGTRAVGLAMAGQPLDAVRAAAGVRSSAEVAHLAILRGELAIADALTHRELGDRQRARAELTAIVDRPVEPLTYARGLAWLELSQLWLDEGDLGAAQAAFRGAEAFADAEQHGSGALDWLARVGTVVALAAGDMPAAKAWCERVQDPFWRPVSLARVHLAVGDKPAADDALERVAARCPRHEVVRDLLRARATAHHEDAVKYATAAVELASAHGMLQTVLSEGDDVQQLVELASWRAPSAWLGRFRRGVPSLVHAARPVVAHPDALTDRERDVLRLLPSRLTQREIAGELSISLNTLKFHLKVIYRKLGVNSRGDAARLARDVLSGPRVQSPNTFER
ncbi:MAG TPA: LuxR C-terminal-related transcriptional regulator [Nocardioidaceae bacterium]